MDVLEVIRLFSGGIFILFVPGFAWSYVFFARKNIDWIERVALSFGLSIALVPLTVFWFNFLFQVKVTLLNTCLVVCGLTIIPAVYILIKRSDWGKNVTSRVKSALRLGRGSKGS
jgi:uncharacterized membrane protein